MGTAYDPEYSFICEANFGVGAAVHSREQGVASGIGLGFDHGAWRNHDKMGQKTKTLILIACLLIVAFQLDLFLPAAKAATLSYLYYFVGQSPTHGQNTGNGYDTGRLSATKPTALSVRNCSIWIQYFYDDATTFSNLAVTSIFYRFYFSSGNRQEKLGWYYRAAQPTGKYGSTVNASTTVYMNTPTTNRWYYGNDTTLYVSEAVIAQGSFTTAFTINGASSYGFDITLTYDDSLGIAYNYHHSSIINDPNGHASFIIFNLPTNATLQAMDSDTDTLSDYDELYTYFTDPSDSTSFDSSYRDNGKAVSGDKRKVFFHDETSKFEKLSASDTLKVTIPARTEPTDPKIRVYGMPIYQSVIKELNSTSVPGQRALLVGDADNDGLNEILVGTPDGYFGVYEADGTLKFSVDIGSEVNGMGIGNLNSTYAGNEIFIGENGGLVKAYKGDGTYAQIWSADLGSQTWAFDVGDADNDGQPELVIGEQDWLLVYSPSFVQEKNISMARAYDVDIGDGDNDGKPDILTTKWGGNLVLVNSSNSGYPTLWQQQIASSLTTVTNVKTIDFDGDGKNEMIGYADTGLEIWRRQAGVSTRLYQNTNFKGNPGAVPYAGMAVGDINGDGSNELFVGAKTYGSALSIPIVHGLTSTYQVFWQWLSGFYVKAMAVGDVDNDGDNDLIIGRGSQSWILTYDGFVDDPYIDIQGHEGVEWRYNGLLGMNLEISLDALKDMMTGLATQPTELTFKTSGAFIISLDLILESPTAASGKYSVNIIALKDGLPTATTVIINGENQTSPTGITLWQLPYGTYTIHIYAAGTNQTAQLLVNSDTTKTFNFITPIDVNNSSPLATIGGLLLVLAAFLAVYYFLFKRR